MAEKNSDSFFLYKMCWYKPKTVSRYCPFNLTLAVTVPRTAANNAMSVHFWFSEIGVLSPRHRTGYTQTLR